MMIAHREVVSDAKSSSTDLWIFVRSHLRGSDWPYPFASRMVPICDDAMGNLADDERGGIQNRIRQTVRQHGDEWSDDRNLHVSVAQNSHERKC